MPARAEQIHVQCRVNVSRKAQFSYSEACLSRNRRGSQPDICWISGHHFLPETPKSQNNFKAKKPWDKKWTVQAHLAVEGQGYWVWPNLEDYGQGPKIHSHLKDLQIVHFERYYLICRKESYSLNKNIEFGDKCLHKRFLRLSTVKWDNPVFVPCGPCLRRVDTSIFGFL